MRSALVIGATGVTGRPLTQYLLNSDHYREVIVLSRRPIGFEHPRLTNHIVDFGQPELWQDTLFVQNKPDTCDLFSCLGTTRKQAGSREAQYQVDVTFQQNVIRVAAQQGVRRLFLVSSPGANANSPLFYARIKGEVDAFAEQQGFDSVVLFKPSLIVGKRPDNRLGEKLAHSLLVPLTTKLKVFSRYQPISGEQLGKAIGHCAEHWSQPGVHTISLEQIFGHQPG